MCYDLWYFYNKFLKVNVYIWDTLYNLNEKVKFLLNCISPPWNIFLKEMREFNKKVVLIEIMYSDYIKLSELLQRA